MPKGLAFWIIYLIAVILYGVLGRPFDNRYWAGFIVFLLLGIIGWATFGPPIT